MLRMLEKVYVWFETNWKVDSGSGNIIPDQTTLPKAIFVAYFEHDFAQMPKKLEFIYFIIYSTSEMKGRIRIRNDFPGSEKTFATQKKRCGPIRRFFVTVSNTPSSQWHKVFLDDVGEVSVELLPEDLRHHTQHQPVRIHPPYSNSRSSK